MTTHENEMKDQDCKPERVVVGVSSQAGEGFSSMEFRWGKFRDAHFTEKIPLVDTNLKGIAVDKFYGRISCNENVPLVDVANDMTVRVDGGDGARDIASGVNQECPIGLRKRELAISWAVERVDRLITRQLGHHKTNQRNRRALMKSGG